MIASISAETLSQALWDLMQAALSNAPLKTVSAFCRRPVPVPAGKAYGIYGIEQLQMQPTVVLPSQCLFDVQAKLSLTLCAPDSYSGTHCYTLFQEQLLPYFLAMPCVFTGYTTQKPQADAKLHRMTLTAAFTLRGVWATETGGVSV